MKRIKYIIISALCALSCWSVSGCSDEPDSENFYIFNGEMMSDYIGSRTQYSDFAKVIDRANLKTLLSNYGHITCFLPSNDAFADYLSERGLTSVDQLTDEECDTIARTHLVNNIYSTMDMNDGALPTLNMNYRDIQITHGFDADSNSVVVLNTSAQIYFELQDDSVENGIVHPISAVLENDTRTAALIMKDNDRIQLFYKALVATGLADSLNRVEDHNYNSKNYSSYKYTSDFWKEVATVPDKKKYGFTLFVEPDDVFKKHGIVDLETMYNEACRIYDRVYPEDVDQPYHAFDQITDRRNPLNRFIAYHILTRDVIGYNYLTPLALRSGIVDGAIGIKTELMNPNDWYETMLPHTMVKLEMLTMREYMGAGKMNRHYINRRFDDRFHIEGVEVLETVESNYVQNALNGRYFYINDILAFDEITQETVQNCRIRMDFSTVFPEVMTNSIRLNGDPTKDDDSNNPDDTYKNGRNYYFPDGYLENVKMKGNCALVYRRPHWNFWSYEGDEWNLFGDYDIEFRLPPVPKSGEYQIRLGFCALPTRGVAQIYFDGVPQGIPIDMRKFLNHESIMGTAFDTKVYTSMTDEEKAEDQKTLKNLGYYRGAYGGYHTDGSKRNEFVDNPRTYRKVLCQVNITNDRDHYLRIRCTSTSKLGNNNEFMIDYLEIVPKSVYGVTGDGDLEDDL